MMTITYEQLMELAIKAKDFRGVPKVKEVLRKHTGPGAAKIRDLLPEQYDAVAADLQALLGNKVMGYAHNSTIAPLPTQSIYDKMAMCFDGDDLETTARKMSMPPQVRAPYGGVPDIDTTAEQVESLAVPRANKMLSGVQAITSREDAIAAVKQLQEQWDLIDDNAVLSQLMSKMEERHGEEFNAFFEATLRQVMIGTGLTELRIDTSAVLLTLAQSAPIRVREAPGYLIYELVEDADVSVDR